MCRAAQPLCTTLKIFRLQGKLPTTVKLQKTPSKASVQHLCTFSISNSTQLNSTQLNSTQVYQ